MTPIRVLVVDDQRVVRDGLTMLLGLLPGIEVVGTAVDGDDALARTGEWAPDVVLMDLSMPHCDGPTATRRILAAHPRTRVVVLTTYSDDDWVFAALDAGARGYVTKDASAEEIRHAITTVAAGQALLDPSVQRRLLDGYARATRPPTDLAGLTGRELDVLRRIAAGLSNAEIAADLVISEATVKTHITHLLAKTGCRDRAQLVALAYRSGLA
ncbi:response regulator [Actinocatenispora rupis]|uniref:DNA-binding response regulator n=1 Tax=Actinocatenispora rupis TaxID=519421 RepID=A0A8J3IXX2_9ACTN|nr:response regulator transcription factor [Actinocatenispora rupis]GID12086.1 DNA-binding response regulator [Actinocatenispora rupis]